jgi:hypothetical protein
MGFWQMSVSRRIPPKRPRRTRGESMLSATFIGEVHQGRVDVPLEFEGKRVKVTLTVVDAPVDVRAEEEAELLEDTGRIGLPPDEVTRVMAGVTDVAAPAMPMYSEDD